MANNTIPIPCELLDQSVIESGLLKQYLDSRSRRRRGNSGDLESMINALLKDHRNALKTWLEYAFTSRSEEDANKGFVMDRDHALLFIETFAALFDTFGHDRRRAAISIVDKARKRKDFEQLHHYLHTGVHIKLYPPVEQCASTQAPSVRSPKRKATANLDEPRAKRVEVEKLPVVEKRKRGRPPGQKQAGALQLKQESVSVPIPSAKGRPGRPRKVKTEDISSLSATISSITTPLEASMLPKCLPGDVTLPKVTTPVVKDEAIETPLHDGFKNQIHLMGLPANCTPPSNRQPCPMQPPIWAESRQELCEAFPWFRSYQGGVYFSNEFAKGYLLSKHSSLRDGWFHDGKLIISHGGGKAASVTQAQGTTKHNAASDQKEGDKSVSALLNTYHAKEPIALVIDDLYVHFPYNLTAARRQKVASHLALDNQNGFTYVILGFYFIKDVWTEYQPADNDGGKVVRYKFAFQWCAGQDDPWWLSSTKFNPSVDSTAVSKGRSRPRPKKVEEQSSDVSNPRRPVQQCMLCGKASPQVYTHVWMCLESTCAAFFHSSEQLQDIQREPNGEQSVNNQPMVVGLTPMPRVLNYHPDFLAPVSDPGAVPKHLKIMPGNPANDMARGKTESDEGTGTAMEFSRGFHCITCGRLSCRWLWRCWSCPTCGTQLRSPMHVQGVRDLWRELNLGTVDNPQMWSIEDKRISLPYTSIIPAQDGDGALRRETFILPDNAGRIHRISHLRRQSPKRADSILALYQDEAQSGALEFRRWPMRAHKCRGKLLTNYFSHNCGKPYNYVGGADNTVDWDVAPQAVIKARELLHERLKHVLNETYEFNEVLSAAYMEDQSMAFHSDAEDGLGPIVAGLSLGSPAKMIFRLHRKHLPKPGDGNAEKKASLRPNALTIVLNHGDICVMDGGAVQERYEHTVVPEGFRIAATARQIDVAKNGLKLK